MQDSLGVIHTDIVECDLGLDVCHQNALCRDTIGSFECTCEDGFVGDGINCSGEIPYPVNVVA